MRNCFLNEYYEQQNPKNLKTSLKVMNSQYYLLPWQEGFLPWACLRGPKSDPPLAPPPHMARGIQSQQDVPIGACPLH